MKKSTILSFISVTTTICLVLCLLIMHPYSINIEASSLNERAQIQNLQQGLTAMTQQANELNDQIEIYGKTINHLEKRLSDLEQENTKLESFLVSYYIDKLKDPTYVIIDDKHENTPYYIAAENLGQIGKNAIPALIQRLDTTDDYERALVLYALLLASQADNMACVCGTDYIHTQLDFDARNHPAQIQIVHTWWEKYKSNF